MNFNFVFFFYIENTFWKKNIFYSFDFRLCVFKAQYFVLQFRPKCFHCWHENLFLQNTKDDFNICIRNDFLRYFLAIYTVITVHTAFVELRVSTRIIFPEICHTHKSRHTGMCILNWLDFLYWLLIIFFEALYLVLLHVHVLKSAWWSWPSKGIKYRACVI